MTSRRNKPLANWSSRRTGEVLSERRNRSTARVVSDCFAHDVRNAATIAVMNAQALSEQLQAARTLVAQSSAAIEQGLAEQEGPADSLKEFQELLAEMQQSCDDCSAGVEHILTLASDLDKVGVEKRRMDVASLVQSALAIVSAEVRLKARLVTELEPLFVDCHPGRLTQMLVNLILNAAHACSRGPEQDCIRVVAKTRGSLFMLSVQDTGCGIAPDNLDAIFEPYVSKRGGGHGLGLTLCKTIAEEHNGDLVCKSEVGSGTVFSFSMPSGGEGLGS
jgi:signal transduction histidine kinase